jgi:hypothetical protein
MVMQPGGGVGGCCGPRDQVLSSTLISLKSSPLHISTVNKVETYGDDRVLPLESNREFLLSPCYGQLPCSSTGRNGDDEVDVFECLGPFVRESSLFSS